MIPSSLRDQLIALPETRELDLFAALLERRGARVLRAPLVAILDAPDPQPVLHWLREFAAGGYHELVLLTGEGLRRLLSCIDKHDAGLRAPFLAALAQTRKITRGPKPARALRGSRRSICVATWWASSFMRPSRTCRCRIFCAARVPRCAPSRLTFMPTKAPTLR